MSTLLRDLQRTTDNKLLGGVRAMLGVMFMMTGVMKLTVPMLWEAWSGQLAQAEMPLSEFNLWFVPIVEVLLGASLLAGFHARIGGAVAAVIMIVATYVHVVVDDPSVFPLQPSAPIMPPMVIAMAVQIVWRGAGAWSIDLRTLPPPPESATEAASEAD